MAPFGAFEGVGYTGGASSHGLPSVKERLISPRTTTRCPLL